ncbi:hypothetical protein [Bradyrhizobium sp. Cp5.3]|nr:hypothetical protein [Bradyrhizobium sp. Cp5.3]
MRHSDGPDTYQEWWIFRYHRDLRLPSLRAPPKFAIKEPAS